MYIWATRGRTWGFRFLHRAGLVDPLPAYSEAFEGYDGAAQLWHRAGKVAALRFEDPLGRRDRAGRVIPHEFVIFDTPPECNSLSDGIALVWPLVEGEYERDYELAEPLVR